jgi:hypothetical protein
MQRKKLAIKSRNDGKGGKNVTYVGVTAAAHADLMVPMQLFEIGDEVHECSHELAHIQKRVWSDD